MPNSIPRRKSHTIWRAIVEVAFIIFLFYANLLMGEFTRTAGRNKTFAHALHDVITPATLVIATASAIIGYVVFQFLREKS